VSSKFGVGKKLGFSRVEMSMPISTENDLYEQIAQYMNLKYPNVLYRFDLGGVWTPSHKARNLYGRLNKRAWPDLFIAKPIVSIKQGLLVENEAMEVYYCGLFLELKKDGTALYKKDGTLRANPHHIEQAMVLKALESQGYKADFAVGYEDAITKIDNYLGDNHGRE
jgi:hypothetical protein